MLSEDSKPPKHPLAVQTRGDQPVEIAAPTMTPAQMLATMTEKGVNEGNVAAFERLCELSWKFEERDAIRAFNSAFVKMQADLPTIVASSEIQNRGKYERFEDVMRQIQPILTTHGFSVSFNQSADDKRVTVVCHLRHEGGHSTETPFSVRVGGRADSETQADCKASTTAKRNALCQALNIVIRQDCLNEENDPRMEGGNITVEQAGELQRRVNETDSNELAFLKLAGITAIAGKPTIEHYKSIMSGKYQMLDDMLKKKEQRGR